MIIDILEFQFQLMVLGNILQVDVTLQWLLFIVIKVVAWAFFIFKLPQISQTGLASYHQSADWATVGSFNCESFLC